MNQIEYDSGVSADNGNELTPTQVQNEPVKIEWPVEEGALYTLCMTGSSLMVNTPSINSI